MGLLLDTTPNKPTEATHRAARPSVSFLRSSTTGATSVLSMNRSLSLFSLLFLSTFPSYQPVSSYSTLSAASRAAQKPQPE
jgi:hypothetical protein